MTPGARILMTVAGLLVGAAAWVRLSGDAASPEELGASMDAAEANMLAIRESLRGSEGRSGTDWAAMRAVRVDACADPATSAGTRHVTTSLLSLVLPADFVLKDAEAAERFAERTGYPAYTWAAPDGSTVTIESANSGDQHSGWTGLIASECDIELGGRRVHVDIANASVHRPDFIVHAHFSDPGSGALALRYVAHARSHERHADLAHAVRTIQIGTRFGVTR